jgi:SM-20-related protein
MTTTLDLRLNPELDLDHFAALYAETGLVQIPNVLDAATADHVHTLLSKHLSWRLVFPKLDTPTANHGAVELLTQADIQRLGKAEMQSRIARVMERARRNIGYLYSTYPMIQAYLEGWDPGHPIHDLTSFLNSPEFLAVGRKVINCPGLTKVDCQATLYGPGQFLTRHVDEGMNQERRAAYTFGFTRNWQTDWGGLLMFIDDALDIERALLPRFNTLSLFDGRKVHAVSAVSPFAGAGRYQITGWLRDDPPADQA